MSTTETKKTADSQLPGSAGAQTLPAAAQAALPLAEKALAEKFGDKNSADIARGVRLCARVWDWTKSDAAGFAAFCVKHYHPPGRARTRLLLRLDTIMNMVGGSMNMMLKTTRLVMQVADEELTPTEELFGAFSASTHLAEDLRAFRIAAVAQLNFGTEDMTPPKTREAWASRRLSKIGRTVVPADLRADESKMTAEVDVFSAGFNLHLDKIEYADGSITFPKDTVRISHWGLRDYMMGLNGQDNALPRQRAIRDLMRRVVDGEIPREAINNPKVRWSQKDGTLVENGISRPATPMGALRWEQFKKIYDVKRRIDPHTHYGNIIDNKFKVEREIPEEKVVQILEDILSSPAMEKAARVVERKLGRPIEPQDIYFKKFQTDTKKTPLSFDIRKRYPDAKSLTAAIPGVLVRLGFSAKRAKWIGERIRVDNSRSAGHAWGPGTSHDVSLLRVRINKGGVTEETFSIFMHELGHCTEQVLSSYGMDYKSLWGVPNIAFTEAFAFTFQDKADFILGRKVKVDPDMIPVQRLWEAFEICGPSLTEIRFFHWLYAHPEATPADMNSAIRRIGDEVWAKFHARIFGAEGYGLMSVYSHILWCSFYLADYGMGYVIAYQVRKFLATRKFAPEMERICSLGSIYPESWMKAAVGESVSAAPLLKDAGAACSRILARA